MPHSIKILREGISSSFQDLGRYNVQYLGIGPSGCMDDDNFKLCNAILHNDENEGMIEFAYQGPKIQIDQATVKICVTGNALFTISNSKGEIVQGQCYRSYYLVKGDVIDIQTVKDSVYGYLGFEGGINLKQYFQSISVNPRSKIGPNNGEKIKNGDMVNVSYAGYFESGALFDSNIENISMEHGKFSANRKNAGGYSPIPMECSMEANLITGFKEGLLLMEIGQKVRLFIPPHLGWGENGAGNVIPPNASVIFDVEVVSRVKE